MKSLKIKCEECGQKLTDKTGREYVQAPGGAWLDVCKSCAKLLSGDADRRLP